MDEKDGGSDWKVRQALYEQVLTSMSDPSPHLLQQLQADLPKYLSDVNPNCLRTALSICELYFASANSINYPQIAQILVDKCFTTNRPGNAEAATALLLKCISKSKDIVLGKIFDELSSKSPKIVRAMIAVLSAHIQATGTSDAAAIIDNLTPLQDHRDQAIRKEATAAIALARGAAPPPQKPPSPQARARSPARPQSHDNTKAARQRSPAHKKRASPATSSSTWTAWVSKETLELFHSSKWTGVVEGLEKLRRQYTEEGGNGSACAYGLTTVFLGKMYTPKVMNQMVSEILFYMKEDLTNLTDDAINACLHFVIDKITEKRLEAQIFEMADLVCELMTPPYVFGVFYPHLSAKNPQLPARIVNYFTHCILAFGADSQLNVDDVSREMKPLCDHSDQNVRKAVFGCIGALATVYGDAVLDSFRSLKQAQLTDVRKSMNLANTTKVATRTTISPKARQVSPPKKSTVPEPVPLQQVASRTSPKKIKMSPRHSMGTDNAEFIPSRLISGLNKSGSALDCRKALDELEEHLERTLEMRGPNSIQQSEFTSVFSALKPWFTDSSTSVVSSVAKVLSLCFKLVRTDQVKNISKDFLSDIFQMLNYTQKTIRSQTLTVLGDISKSYPGFVADVFLPAFATIGVDGKKPALTLLRDLEFDMTIDKFLPFIVNCLVQKSEDLREASSPIVHRFLRLPGAADAVRDYVSGYPPSKKNAILSMIDGDAPAATTANVFLTSPTESQRTYRHEKIDPFLPLKVMNGTEVPDVLTDLLVLHGKRYFAIDFAGETADPAEITKVGSVFLNAARNSFDNLSLVVDIVFLWWAQQSLLIRHQDGFDSSFEFMNSFLTVLLEHRRTLDQFEIALVLPTVLECVGREYSACVPIKALLQKLTPANVFLVTVIRILGSVTSVFAVQADLDTLLAVLPTAKSNEFKSELARTASRLHMILAKEPTKNPKLFATSTQFLEYLKSIGALATVSEPRPISQCTLNPKIEAKMKSPQILVYGWIVDLGSQDGQTVIQALKAISSKLKTNPEIFEPHLEVLTVSIINLIHFHLADPSSDERLNKYCTFCLLSLFNETSLKNVIPPVFVHQLVYELLTHLSNGVNEAMLNQVLNALIVKLIDDCTVFAFQGLLSAIGEYENKDMFTDRWIKLALKCFEACGVRICEVGQEDDVKEAIIMLEAFLEMHPHERLLSSSFGPKILHIARSFVELVVEKFSNVVNSREIRKRLGPNPKFMDLLEQE